jgi:hypothetical protein
MEGYRMKYVKKILICLSICVLGVAVVNLTQATTKSSNQDIATSIVQKYIQQFSSSPETDVFTAINDKSSNEDPKFFVLVFDLNGVIKAWSFMPSKVGTNVSAFLDISGNKTMVDVLKIVKGQTSGWYNFQTKNPFLGQSGNIKSYYEVFNNYVVACGYFE